MLKRFPDSGFPLACVSWPADWTLSMECAELLEADVFLKGDWSRSIYCTELLLWSVSKTKSLLQS